MAKVTEDNKKWGKAGNGMFVGDELVDLLIPIDKLNPAKEQFFCINGVQIWVAKGKKTQVPKSVADLWNYSYQGTTEAEEKMSQEIEIKA